MLSDTQQMSTESYTLEYADLDALDISRLNDPQGKQELASQVLSFVNKNAGDFRGYKPRSTGELGARDNDERYNIPKFTPEHERSHPKLIQDHFDEIKEFSLHVHNQVLLPLLRLFAYVLEIDESYFASRHRYEARGLEYLRYMKYFPRTEAEDAAVNNIWAKGHTDYNTLTFLFHQPVSGLQVQTPEGWKYVKSFEDAIIVNVAYVS
ncbi:putative 1-aminocyclopropane-1-carboxylate oxidase [Aureobasidium pullulans]|nr:putative 1-aminocyclopropane-1-carboxylate oxidase [Aureobasidium pullulans]